MLFFALLDIVYCYSLIFPSWSARNSESFKFLSEVFPIYVWGSLWGIVGLICLVSAFIRSDKFGFSAAIGIKILWGSIYIGAQVWGGVERGYVSAAIWLALAALIFILASWPEPPEKGKSWTPPSS